MESWKQTWRIGTRGRDGRDSGAKRAERQSRERVTMFGFAASGGSLFRRSGISARVVQVLARLVLVLASRCGCTQQKLQRRGPPRRRRQAAKKSGTPNTPAPGTGTGQRDPEPPHSLSPTDDVSKTPHIYPCSPLAAPCDISPHRPRPDFACTALHSRLIDPPLPPIIVEGFRYPDSRQYTRIRQHPGFLVRTEEIDNPVESFAPSLVVDAETSNHLAAHFSRIPLRPPR